MSINDKRVDMPGGRLMLELDEETKQVRLIWVFEDVYDAMLMHDKIAYHMNVMKDVHLTLVARKG